MSTPQNPAPDSIEAALAEAQRETRDRISALLQLQTDRMRDLLSRDWQDQACRIVDERFACLSATVHDHADAELQMWVREARREIVQRLGDHLNSCFHRMRDYASDRHWCDALLDAAGALCGRCAFFSIRGREVCFQGIRGMEDEQRPAPPNLPLADVPAFSTVAANGEASEVRRTRAELSSPIAALLDEAPDKTALLLPVATVDRVVGILYVEEPSARGALEAIATVAGVVLENHLATADYSRPSTTVRSAVETPPAPEVQPVPQVQPVVVERLQLPLPDRSQLQAQRFARVQVAEMLLQHSGEVRRGRADRDLYARLRPEIDRLRDAYRRQFLKESPSSVDYVHDELVRTLANNDPGMLGSDYPGKMA